VHIAPGTRAFVTGASRGIGRVLAERLAARGATVGLAARSADELAALADALTPGATPHQVLACDVADRDAVRAAVQQFVSAAGGLDLLVANAGIAHYVPFRDQPAEQVLRLTDVNWLGTVHTVSAGLEHMLDRASGHVVIVSSGMGLRGFPWAAVYAATKGAQRLFGEALRHELSGTGVSLTMVYPGLIATSLHDHERETMPDWYQGATRAVPALRLAERVIRAVERDDRAVYFPAYVRLLAAAQGLSPPLTDRLLRRAAGPTAAPRLD
jgi:short-subunit dehydrogenase